MRGAGMSPTGRKRVRERSSAPPARSRPHPAGPRADPTAHPVDAVRAGRHTATPDSNDSRRRAAKTRAVFEVAQVELTGMRYGPGPDGTPTVVEMTRADGLWPFLVIRTYPGDDGARPIQRPRSGDRARRRRVQRRHPRDARRPAGSRRSSAERASGRSRRGVGNADAGAAARRLGPCLEPRQMPATAIRVRVRLQPTDFWPSNWPDPTGAVPRRDVPRPGRSRQRDLPPRREGRDLHAGRRRQLLHGHARGHR